MEKVKEGGAFFGKLLGGGNNKVFGVPLEEAQRRCGHPIPPVLFKTIQYLLQEDRLKQEGIFRKSGNHTHIQEMKQRFDKGEDVDLSAEPDMHTVCGLLKQYLRELPEPLCTFELYDCFIAATGIPDSQICIQQLCKVLDMLPDNFKIVLKYLVGFLRKVVSYSEFNLMNATNVSVVFAPNVIRPRGDELGAIVEYTPMSNKTMEIMIQHYDQLNIQNFPDPPELSTSSSSGQPEVQTKTSWQVTKLLPPGWKPTGDAKGAPSGSSKDDLVISSPKLVTPVAPAPPSASSLSNASTSPSSSNGFNKPRSETVDTASMMHRPHKIDVAKAWPPAVGVTATSPTAGDLVMSSALTGYQHDQAQSNNSSPTNSNNKVETSKRIARAVKKGNKRLPISPGLGGPPPNDVTSASTRKPKSQLAMSATTPKGSSQEKIAVPVMYPKLNGSSGGGGAGGGGGGGSGIGGIVANGPPAHQIKKGGSAIGVSQSVRGPSSVAAKPKPGSAIGVLGKSSPILSASPAAAPAASASPSSSSSPVTSHIVAQPPLSVAERMKAFTQS